jgi:hypothetical protein
METLAFIVLAAFAVAAIGIAVWAVRTPEVPFEGNPYGGGDGQPRPDERPL